MGCIGSESRCHPFRLTEMREHKLKAKTSVQWETEAFIAAGTKDRRNWFCVRACFNHKDLAFRLSQARISFTVASLPPAMDTNRSAPLTNSLQVSTCSDQVRLAHYPPNARRRHRRVSTEKPLLGRPQQTLAHQPRVVYMCTYNQRHKRGLASLKSSMNRLFETGRSEEAR
jgi:hypothetical protein